MQIGEHTGRVHVMEGVYSEDIDKNPRDHARNTDLSIVKQLN